MRRISVIIPAHNEEKLIAKTIRSIKKQTHDNVEIIVVVNGCTDRTEEIAQKEGAKIIMLHEANVSLARNEGARRAEGEILAFIDADTTMERHLLEYVEQAKEKGYICSTCKVVPDNPTFKHRFICGLTNLSSYLYLLPNGFIACKTVNFSPFDIRVKVSEDAMMFRKLAKKGKAKYITDSYVKTSMRRFKNESAILILFKYIIGRWFIRNPKYEPVR